MIQFRSVIRALREPKAPAGKQHPSEGYMEHNLPRVPPRLSTIRHSFIILLIEPKFPSTLESGVVAQKQGTRGH